ncbi:MAG: DUF4957 domain-containing protein [Bacteroidota bacterium]
MKSLKTFKINAWLILLSAVAILSSCKKNDPNKDLASPRLFKPSGISVKTTATNARITWTPSLFSTGQKLTYTAQFSQDSTFATSEFTLQADTAGLTVADDKITIRKKYYMRLKANAYLDQPESNWVTSSGFTIIGEQFFLPIRDLELKETSVTLRWTVTAGLTSVALGPKGGTATSYPINAGEATAGIKTVTTLTAGTDYTAELFAGTKSKGLLNFTTVAATVYTTILNSGADLVAAVNAAADNAVIGLNPGTYSAGTANFILLQKTVTIKSTSGNPTDTKVNFKEFDLKGNGAGINFAGIELDGTASGALYFINPTGVLADAEKCAYTQVTLNNCIMHGATTSFMRANRGAAGGDYTMDNITVKNCVIYDVASTLGYTFLHLDKLQFNTLTFSKTTMYNFGRELLSCSTALTSTPPTITFDYCTMNNFGAQGLYVLMDANANPVKFNITNSILGNVPRPAGTVQNVVLRASGAGSSTVFNNNNTFNFTNGAATPLALTYPTANITMIGNQSVSLGWTATTTDFTLPAGSPLRTASNVSTPIGDPRWTY